jgi:hypothetical protein
MRRALMFSLLLGILLAVGSMLTPPASADQDLPWKPSSGTRPGALLWGGGLFLDKGAFRDWLAGHGQPYPAWSVRHPTARAILGGGVNPKFREWQFAPRVSGTGSSSGGSRGFILVALAAGAVSMIAFASMPVRRAGRYAGAVARVADGRVGVFAVGVGILLGVVVSRLV